MNLFESCNFIAASGRELTWRIECDAFTPMMWDWAARCIADAFKFSEVFGVPRGGLPLEERLKEYRGDSGGILIVDDVFTTGGSIMKMIKEKGLLATPTTPKVGVQACVVFARNKPPSWISALWTAMPGMDGAQYVGR